MYSGITRGLFEVTQVINNESSLHYSVRLSQQLVQHLKIGSSVNVDGVCQSVTHIENNEVYFTAIAETLGCTTLNTLYQGRLVSIEPSLCFGDEVGGHLLAGHVMGTAQVIALNSSCDNLSLSFQCRAEWMKYILPKGFIGVDGCSLTVNTPEASGYFTVHLIPETLRVTNFSNKRLGDQVNIELDQQTQAIVDTVERVLANHMQRGL